MKKSKTIAIILAIIISVFALLYTYKKDKKKFWIAMLILLMGIILNYILFNGIGTAVSMGIWIYTLGIAIQRPKEWYEGF